MKRLTALLLVLLIIAGCAVQEPDPTTVPTTEPTTQPTTETTLPPGAGLYVENSALEQMTGGAVKAYNVHEACEAVYPMGDNLLLFLPQSSAEKIQVYEGEELWLQHAVSTVTAFVPGDRGVQISETGLSYYIPGDRQLVLLDASLQEKSRITMPENIQGVPVVNPDQTKAYFCTENEIRVMDLTTGIAALLRQEAVVWQSIWDVCFDGKVLLCDVIDRNQNGYLAYIDTENGKLLDKDDAGWGVDTFGDAFLLHNAGEAGKDALYGTWNGDVVNFVPSGDDARIWSALPLDGAVAAYTGEDGLVLDFYTLSTGLRTASVTLTEGTDALGFVADETNGCIWFLLTDADSEEKTLCRWDISASAVTDETVYLLPRYTELAPDVEGLSQCQSDAQDLGGAYGMEIRIWQDAVTAPWTKLRSDYRVSSFRAALETMEQVLAVFPEGMVAKLATLSDTGVTSVSIVRGEEETAQSHFKWVDGSIYIALETGENGEGAFCNALYRAMDTYIFNRNSMLDEWDSRNPMDDRAMIFQYAMTEGMEDFFEDEDAQSKLKQLCKAIRDAFELKKYEGELLWEQYLDD